MTEMTGESITRWTVRAALAFYALTTALRFTRPDKRSYARLLWTAGCLMFLAHVVAAFHVFHGWSHGRAYAETARQTRELFGLDWGGGLYFNYLFTLAWFADVIYWWWGGLDAYERRPRRVDAVLHAFFAFMAFNGAVVFARGATRWVALVATAALGLLVLVRFLRVCQRADGRGA